MVHIRAYVLIRPFHPRLDASRSSLLPSSAVCSSSLADVGARRSRRARPGPRRVAFSTRLRQRHLQLHRVLGRIYVGSVVVSAPVAIAVAIALPIPTLLMASSIQALGWLIATGTAIYCARIGKIQQHREWMMRGYPFAAVFVIVRVIVAIPAINRMGPLGIATVVWSVIAVASFLPSFVIAWQALAASKRAVKVRTVPAAS